MTGNGSFASPWDFVTALSSQFIFPVDTLELRAGTYSGGDLAATIAGNSLSPLLIRAYQNEQVVVNGQISLANAPYVILDGLIITNAENDRLTYTKYGVVPGESVIFRNCTIKNFYQGMVGGSTYQNITFDGCLVYYNGSDTQLGHGLYIQHNDLGGLFTVKNCIIHSNFGYGIHCYGSNPLYDFLFENNTIFESGSIRGFPVRNILAGGTGGIYGVTIRGNKTYYRDTTAGEGLMANWGPNTGENFTIQNNFISGGSLALRLQNNPEIIDMSGNSFYGGFLPVGTDTAWPDNTYGTFANTPDTVFLDALEDANRANLTIYNKQTQANTVNVDVSALFGQSGTVKAYNAQDPLVDIQTLTITAGIIAVDMTAGNRTVETPVGWPAPATTFPSFGCFRLVKQ